MLAEKMRFLIAGGSTTAFSYALYAALLYIGVPATPAYVFAYLAGFFWAYVINSLWVFRSPMTIGRLIRFPAVYLVQAAASFLLFHIMHRVFGINPLLVPILIAVMMVPITYLLSRLILVGRQRRVQVNEDAPLR